MTGELFGLTVMRSGVAYRPSLVTKRSLSLVLHLVFFLFFSLSLFLFTLSHVFSHSLSLSSRSYLSHSPSFTSLFPSFLYLLTFY